MPGPSEASVEHRYTRGEEVANTVSAAVGLVVSIGVAPFLMLAALRSPQSWAFVSAAIFLLSVLLLYLTSTIYHALAPGKAKDIARILETTEGAVKLRAFRAYERLRKQLRALVGEGAAR